MISEVFNAWLNGYKRIFCYTGRERRRSFGFFLIVQCIVFFIVAFIAAALFGSNGAITEFIATTLIIVSMLATLSYNVRRLHDSGQSGWWCLGWLIFAAAFIGAALVMKPTLGDNQYGPDPRVNK